mmetsp:Transcript_11328/g.21959  ORF Transcript_11328/g.21959 Transcript_11328/m.21959 type:complete len:230 (+) Transcript_11328:224-913(+)
MPRIGAEHARVDAQQAQGLVVALLDRRVEDDGRRGVDRQPTVAADFLFELAGGPAAVAQGDQQLARPGAIRQRLQHVAAGGHLQAAGHGQRRVVVRPFAVQRLMQHKATVRLHRPAVEHRALGQAVGGRAELDLLEETAQRQRDRLVDHQPQGAVVVVLAEVDHGARKGLVGHARHGDEELVGQDDPIGGHGRHFILWACKPPPTALNAPSSGSAATCASMTRLPCAAR